LAAWTTPPTPADATALSFGLALTSAGSVTTDDYTMTNELPGLQNASLEKGSTGSGAPNCFQADGYGANTYAFARTTDAHTGTYAEKLTVSTFSSGDRKLMTALDQGTCAPAISGGHTYTVGAWYKSNASPAIILFYRTANGTWTYWTSSPAFSATSAYTLARWTTPPAPSQAVAVSFGLGLVTTGSITTDDYTFSQAT
jgi:hypothetical protein